MHSSHILRIHTGSMFVPDGECFKTDEMCFIADFRATVFEQHVKLKIQTHRFSNM